MIYLIMADHGIEGQTLVGVFSTEKKAKKILDQLKQIDSTFYIDNWEPNTIDSFYKQMIK